jgi:hypothetical protein
MTAASLVSSWDQASFSTIPLCPVIGSQILTLFHQIHLMQSWSRHETRQRLDESRLLQYRYALPWVIVLGHLSPWSVLANDSAAAISTRVVYQEGTREREDILNHKLLIPLSSGGLFNQGRSPGRKRQARKHAAWALTIQGSSEASGSRLISAPVAYIMFIWGLEIC